MQLGPFRSIITQSRQFIAYMLNCDVICCLFAFLSINGLVSSSRVLIFPVINLRLVQQVSIGLSKLTCCCVDFQ